MDNQIGLRIELDEENLTRDPFFLQNLEQDFKREIHISISRETRKLAKGAMGPDLIVAIELAGVTVTALGTVWTILQIRYRGEVTIEKELPDGRKITVKKGNLTDAQLRKEMENIDSEVRAEKIRKLYLKMTGK